MADARREHVKKRTEECNLDDAQNSLQARRHTNFGKPGCGGIYVADANSKFNKSIIGGLEGAPSKSEKPNAGHGIAIGCTNVADADFVRQSQQGRSKRKVGRRIGDSGGRDAIAGLGQPASGPANVVDETIARGWPSDWESGVTRTTIEKEHRIDRLRALGNAVVPAVAAHAWTVLHRQAMQADSPENSEEPTTTRSTESASNR